MLAIGLLLIIIRIFIKPFKSLGLMLLSSALGCVGLYAFNFIAKGFGMAIGVNAVTSSVCGLLGVPGLVSLTALKLIFGI